MSTKMTFGTKLTTGFAAMLALSSILSLTSLKAIATLKDGFDTTVSMTVRRLELAGSIDAAQSKMFAHQRGILIYSFINDVAHRDQFRREFDRDAAAMRGQMEELKPLLATERGRQLVHAIETAMDQWQSEFQRIIAAANAGNPALALELSREKVLPLHDAIGKAVNDLIEIQHRFLQADKEEAAQSYSLHRWIAGLGFLLSLALGAGVLFTVRHANRTLKNVAGRISNGSVQVAGAAAQVASSSQSLAQGASEQAASLEETSASAEEITSMTRKNAENSQAVAKLMAETEVKVGGANSALDQMVTSMQEIDGSSDKVAKIIKTSFLKNLLTLRKESAGLPDTWLLALLSNRAARRIGRFL
jgi:methyl-accepting chemotaxis protein/methyl-accepting chemotaxis protein-1 (serine sensor receptor)